MSSRSLAAARARRAGENAPPVSGNRPGISIGSHAGFAPHQVPNAPNVRVSRSQMPLQQQSQNTYQQIQQSQQSQNGLPFNKLSIADAIGLITLRLGRVEQWIIETEHENENEDKNVVSGLPENSRIIDNSVLTNFASRLDSLEKKDLVNNDTEGIKKLSEDIANTNQHLAKIVEEASKHALTTAKHTEQLLRFERELVETKDILKTFMLKYDMFTTEINEKLNDYEYAIADLEKNIPINENMLMNNEDEDTSDVNNELNENTYTDSLKTDPNTIFDLKSAVKKEFEEINDA